jgi:hypothetical protein
MTYRALCISGVGVRILPSQPGAFVASGDPIRMVLLKSSKRKYSRGGSQSQWSLLGPGLQ